MKYRKTILIVCEGAKTEPNYFSELREEVIEACGSEVFIKILPLPKEVDCGEEEKGLELRRGAKRRYIRESLSLENIEDYAIEDEFKAQPTCYIRKAQLGYKEHGYDELWAVYDLDGHADQKGAFDLSINAEYCEVPVNIAFSSISFETWILLHFELDFQSYSKSACREKNRHLNCGTKTHPLDCEGKLCVCGKLVTSRFLNYSRGKDFEYASYESTYKTAVINAVKLREAYVNDSRFFYEHNPYTSVDRLVLKLKLLHHVDLIWKYSSQFCVNNQISVEITKTVSEVIVKVLNLSDLTYIIKGDDIQIINQNLDLISVADREILEGGALIEKEISFRDYVFYHILIRTGGWQAYIIDLPSVQSVTSS